MNNLNWIGKEASDQINSVLNDPSVHTFTKDVIKQGLKKDCCDAVNDVFDALDVLKLVRNYIIKR